MVETLGHTRRAIRAMGVACKEPASPTTVKKGGGRWRGSCTLCQTAKDRKTDWKCCHAQNGCARTTLSRQFK